jgi:hypothetical protein
VSHAPLGIPYLTIFVKSVSTVATNVSDKSLLIVRSAKWGALSPMNLFLMTVSAKINPLQFSCLRKSAIREYKS